MPDVMAFNSVELMAADDCAFDQRCRFGHRVEGHAVYCHNDLWDDGPRKCRRSWYTDGRVRDEDCPGFEPNPSIEGGFDPTPLSGPVCQKCQGRKLIATDRGRTETCPLCMGSGCQPQAVALSPYGQDTLEIGSVHFGSRGTEGHPFLRIVETKEETESIRKLCDLGLIKLLSVTLVRNIPVYLLENTLKGEATLRQNWQAKKLKT